MITHVEIQNYRSIWQASVPLSPFTLLIGANGTGKSNLLRLLRAVSLLYNHTPGDFGHPYSSKHVNHIPAPQNITLTNDRNEISGIRSGGLQGKIPELASVRVFSINPAHAGQAEKIVANPTVNEDGSGVVQVLDALKTGDREDLFNTIEAALKAYIPEIEKLSFVPGIETKKLQVREKDLGRPIPVSELSEGTRLVLTILTIIYQENPPSVICLEEIDRGMHPRLFEQVVQLCFDMTHRENGPQIIATTHNPYLVDQFKDHESAVIIVEKENGETKFTTLAERLQHLEPGEEPLGSLWYSGFVGGAPMTSVHG